MGLWRRAGIYLKVAASLTQAEYKGEVLPPLARLCIMHTYHMRPVWAQLDQMIRCNPRSATQRCGCRRLPASREILNI